MRLVFDIETNGLFFDATRIHCVAFHDLDTEETFIHSDQGSDKPTVVNALTILETADLLIGHNIIGFDIPAIQKLYPFFKPSGMLMDTLVLSRLRFPDLKNLDFRRKAKSMPLHLYGRHSLEAWGYRLGEYKGEFGKAENAFNEWSPAMEDYCIQDLCVTTKLWNLYQKAYPGL